jgi:hypothetical protein
MSASEADRFIADLKSSPEQFDGLQQLAKDGHADQAYAKVRAMGYDATVDELGDAFMEYISEELGEEELARVAGGISDGAVIGAAVGGAAAAGVGAGVVIATVVVVTSSAAGAAAAI